MIFDIPLFQIFQFPVTSWLTSVSVSVSVVFLFPPLVENKKTTETETKVSQLVTGNGNI